MAFTAPGSRVVHVCVDQLKQVQLGQPDYVIAALIHEILHTLGLGEDPPSSSDIARRVLAGAAGGKAVHSRGSFPRTIRLESHRCQSATSDSRPSLLGKKLVTLIFISWNPLSCWLRQIAALKRAA